jgi:hypothetical protein
MQSRAGGVDLGRLAEDVQETGKAGGRRGYVAGAREEKDGDVTETGMGISGARVLAWSRIVSWYGSVKSGHAGAAVRD